MTDTEEVKHHTYNKICLPKNYLKAYDRAIKSNYMNFPYSPCSLTLSISISKSTAGHVIGLIKELSSNVRLTLEVKTHLAMIDSNNIKYFTDSDVKDKSKIPELKSIYASDHGISQKGKSYYPKVFLSRLDALESALSANVNLQKLSIFDSHQKTHAFSQLNSVIKRFCIGPTGFMDRPAQLEIQGVRIETNPKFIENPDEAIVIKSFCDESVNVSRKDILSYFTKCEEYPVNKHKKYLGKSYNIIQ